MTDPEKMRLIMKSLNMTQKEIAEKSGLTQSLISDVVTGKRKATYHIINSIGKATGLNQDWWFNQRGKIFTDRDASFTKPIDISKDELIRILSEQNETLKARIRDQQKIIQLMEGKNNSPSH